MNRWLNAIISMAVIITTGDFSDVSAQNAGGEHNAEIAVAPPTGELLDAAEWQRIGQAVKKSLAWIAKHQ